MNCQELTVKCPSKLSRAQNNGFKFPVLSKQSKTQKQAANPLIWEAEKSKYLAFLLEKKW